MKKWVIINIYTGKVVKIFGSGPDELNKAIAARKQGQNITSTDKDVKVGDTI